MLSIWKSLKINPLVESWVTIFHKGVDGVQSRSDNILCADRQIPKSSTDCQLRRLGSDGKVTAI